MDRVQRSGLIRIEIGCVVQKGVIEPDRWTPANSFRASGIRRGKPERRTTLTSLTLSTAADSPLVAPPPIGVPWFHRPGPRGWAQRQGSELSARPRARPQRLG